MKRMKRSFDSSLGRYGRPEPEAQGKTRITIRLDAAVIDYFQHEARRFGGKVGYQTLINTALCQYVEGRSPEVQALIQRDYGDDDDETVH